MLKIGQIWELKGFNTFWRYQIVSIGINEILLVSYEENRLCEYFLHEKTKIMLDGETYIIYKDVEEEVYIPITKFNTRFQMILEKL